jgi:hypothetical protein
MFLSVCDESHDNDIKFGPNSDYAGGLEIRKSTSGYIFKLGNGAISWRWKLQDCTVTSTTAAEYVVVSDAAKEALWLGRLARMFR